MIVNTGLDAMLNAIKLVATAGRNEEDLKMTMEPLLRDRLKEVDGVSIQPSYEVRTGLAGRRDAVYGHFTLEYKSPGFLSSEHNRHRAAQQLAEYLENVIGDSPRDEALKRVAGACTDGQQIFFLRFWPHKLIESRQVGPRLGQLSFFGKDAVTGGFQMMGPYSLNLQSLEELFRYIRALSRLPLVAEALAETFGPGQEVSERTVGALFEALTKSTNPRVSILYQQWERVFGIVYGEDTGRAERDVPELASGYGLPKDAQLKPALFTVHTYFALIMKLIAAEVLALQEGSMARSLLGDAPLMTLSQLRERMSYLEDGEDYRVHGINNFLEGDYFQWYVDAWNDDVGSAVRTVIRRLSDFEGTTPTLRPGEARDLLKKLYQFLVPKKLRHDLGEYYTPDWIADHVLNQLEYDGDPSTRLLDPACGSGTFLTLALGRVRERMELELWDRDMPMRKACAEQVLRNIVGFDLNPLAVIAARTNFLLAFGDLLRDVRPIELPIYNCDAILTPILQKDVEYGDQTDLFGSSDSYFFLPTAAGEFRIPKTVIQENALGQLTSSIEQCIQSGYSPGEFVSQIGRVISLDAHSRVILDDLFSQIAQLEREGRNGVWARLLKNSFAPVLQDPFDIVAGNPPWVNWESLAPSWRNLSKDLWVDYGLFSLKGHRGRLGGGKKDLSMLFTYACADHYLKDQGKLGFVITQTVFKSKDAGDGFRRFRLGKHGERMKIVAVDDMVDLQPFEGATNRTATFLLTKQPETDYPLSYTVWRKKQRGRIPFEASINEVQEITERRDLLAEPVDESRKTSPWLTSTESVISAVRKAVGQSGYQAFSGSCGWRNSVYWVDVIEHRPDGLVVVENLADIGDKKVDRVRASIEPDLLYPLLRGKDVAAWNANPVFWQLLTQDPERRAGWCEQTMRADWPHTYRFLLNFERDLRERSGFKQYFSADKDPFWSLYNVGPYSLKPYKVVWKEQAANLTCAVVSSVGFHGGESKVVVPDHKLMFVPADTAEEAHFICAVLSSRISQMIVKAYTVSTSTSTHVMNHIRVPVFNPSKADHRNLQAISVHLHRDPIAIDHLQGELDQQVAELWGISDKELKGVVEEWNRLQH